MAEKKKICKIVALVVVVLALGGLFYLEEMTFGWFLGRATRSVRKQAEMERFKQNLRNPPHPNLAVKTPDSKRELKKLVNKYVDEKDPSYLQGIAAIRDKELIGQLCKYALNGVEDEEPYLNAPLQVSAITALGEIKDQQGAKCLEDLLGDPNKLISCNASIALGKIGAKNSIQKMIENISQSDDCSVLGISEFGVDGLKAILAALKDPSISEGQKRALEASIYDMRDPKSKPLLKDLFKSDDHGIRMAAGSALYRMVSAEDVDYFIEYLEKTDLEKANLYWPMLSLEKLGDPKALPVVENIYEQLSENKGDIHNRSLAFQTLAKLKGEAFCPEISKALNDPNQEIRDEALKSMGYCNQNASVAELVERIKFPEKFIGGEYNQHEMRSNAFRSFSKINSLYALNSAIELTKSQDAEVAEMGVTAMRYISELNPGFQSTAKKVYLELLENDKRKKVGEACLSSLAVIFANEAVPILEKYVNDPVLGPCAKYYLGQIKAGFIKKEQSK